MELVAISTDSIAGLQKTFSTVNPSERLPFPLLSDTDHEIFRRYRAYDDFERMPLHGTFLIDAAGFMRWHTIGFEPFTEPRFLLLEAKRLLAIPVREPTGLAAR